MDIKVLIDAIEQETATLDAFYAFFSISLYRTAFDAYNGSMDSARKLHHKTLPRTNQWTCDEGPSGCGATVVVWPDGLSGLSELVFNGYDVIPSRAWLIAIIKACKETQ